MGLKGIHKVPNEPSNWTSKIFHLFVDKTSKLFLFIFIIIIIFVPCPIMKTTYKRKNLDFPFKIIYLFATM
jgi:hypothetical protein